MGYVIGIITQYYGLYCIFVACTCSKIF